MTVKLLHKNPPHGYCSTPTAEDIHNLLAICRKHCMMGVVVGEPGTGKSMAVAAYAAIEKGIVLCRVTKAASDIQPLLVRLCGALGENVSPNQSKADLYETALWSLTQPFAAKNLLLFDEAQHLSDDALECARDLFDESQVGVVLVGNKGLKRWETSQKSKKANSFAQLRGRIGQFLDLKVPLDEDLAAICEYHKLQDCLPLIRKVAKKEGQLHLVAKLIQVAGDLVEEGQSITPDVLKGASTIVGVTL
jgi:DNA transposition AAA+ family ATPase